MKHVFILLLLVSSILFSCSPSIKTDSNLIVKGTIRGLRQGTLLLKKVTNDSLKSIDTIKVDGNEKFAFHTNIDQAQLLLLELPEIKDGRIIFFAAPYDTIKIFTYLESFGINPMITGGVNQQKYATYKKMIQKFNEKELDLFKAKFDALKNHLLNEADSIDKQMNKLKRKRTLYVLNFVFTNKELAVSPYVANSEFYNNTKALDTIYKVLPERLKQSIYGKDLKKILKR